VNGGPSRAIDLFDGALLAAANRDPRCGENPERLPDASTQQHPCDRSLAIDGELA